MRFTFTAAFAVIASAATGPAAAMVAGADAPGLARHTVMVLGSKGGFCTGVVVARNAVLTAGHCATGSGDYRVHWKDAAGQPVLVKPAAIAPHPQFDRAGATARRRTVDLALIRLAEPLPASFTPLPLGSAMPTTGQAWTVAGYGLATEGDPRTGGTLRQASLGVVEPYGPSKILVWLRGTPGSGACTGDSGGPILDPIGTLGAITAWAEGTGKARCGALTQGVLVAPQRGWIEGVLAGWR